MERVWFSPSTVPIKSEQTNVQFMIRVERRPDDDAFCVVARRLRSCLRHLQRKPCSFGTIGILPPIVAPEGKIVRDRTAEMQAVQMLYALDLQPGAEQPPNSLRKVARAPQEGVLWAADKQAWPHPQFYWQRFRHEAVNALEKRGWEVQFSAQVGLKPLVFSFGYLES